MRMFVLRTSLLSLACSFFAPRVLFAENLKPVPIEASNPREDLRLKIFGADIKKRQCETLSRSPDASFSHDQSLQDAVTGIIKSIQTRNEKELLPYFNPRLKVKTGHISSAFLSLKKITGSNPQVTNYRVLALNSPDGSTAPIECKDTGVLVHPLYGFPLVVGLWLQATGEEEVAKVFIELVPILKGKDKVWSIGAWHVQQWTHTEKDFAQWYEIAQKESQAGRKTGAFIASDIAAKLLDGGGFLVFPVKEDAEKWRDQLMTKEVWTQEIQKTFPNDKLIYAATLFVRSGAGVLLRFRVDGEKSAHALKDHCKKSLELASASPWGGVIAGIRCSYNLPAEGPLVEGVLGSMYVSKDELTKSSK